MQFVPRARAESEQAVTFGFGVLEVVEELRRVGGFEIMA